MAGIAVTYTFSNSTTADATQVNQNFTDIINGLSDGTKDLSINALTVAGNASFSGNITFGNASGDDVIFTGSLASTIPIKTTNTYDLGSSTLGMRAIYFGGNSQTVNIKASGSMSATWTFTLPVSAGSADQYMATNGSGVTTWTTFLAPTIQKFTSGSGTYTKPTAPRAPIAIRVRLIGGGGGGAGGGSGGGTGGTGGTTTFGSSLLTATGGVGGLANADGGAGGTASLGTGPIGTALTGGTGQAGNGGTTVGTPSGSGAASPFGGAGGGAANGSAGFAGATNTGSGGSGGTGVIASITMGGGGGAGGFVDALISSPSSTYAYAVGAAGTAGTAGTSGTIGGAGGSGYIEVTEYYQ